MEHILFEFYKKIISASDVSLVFEKHNSNEKNISSLYRLNYTQMLC